MPAAARRSALNAGFLINMPAGLSAPAVARISDGNADRPDTACLSFEWKLFHAARGAV